MPRNYYELVPHTFKRFSILSARRTLLPTLLHELKRSPLPKSPKPALFTMNILPPIMTVWYHMARKSLGDKVDIVIFDSSGKLNPQDFPGARVQKFLNLYAATKCDIFLNQIARNRKVGWLCDDDVFILSPETLDIIHREFQVPNTASVSFEGRKWWEFEINGKHITPSATYCTALNREVVIEREHLSLKPADGNKNLSIFGKPVERYDTFDKANEILLKKGYRMHIVPEKDRSSLIAYFAGLANGVMLLNYFNNPQQVEDYFLSPPKERWRGNILFRGFSAILTISHLLDLAETLTGKRYPLPALPSQRVLERIRREHEPLLRKDVSFEPIDETVERLRAHL